MATKISKKPGSLVDKNKDFMANFSYDMLNKNKPVPAQPTAMPSQPLRQAAPYDPVAEVQAATKGAQQMPTPQGYRRPVTRRGMSGAELDANGNDSGSGMNWFDKNNSPAQVDARNARQGVLDQRRGSQMAAAGASAVAERKALQEMGQAPFQLDQANRAANSVKGNDGYMTLFDGKGNAVGTNRPPVKREFDPGTSSTNPMNPGLQQQIQQGFNQDAQKPRAPQPSSPNFLDSYAIPGGSNASVVGAPSAPGTPVGGNVSPPRAGGIAPVDFFGNIDTSNAPPPAPQPDWVNLMQPPPPQSTELQAYGGFIPPPPLERLTPPMVDNGNPRAPMDNPYGVNGAGIPALKGFTPQVGQMAGATGAYVNDIWAGLTGQPQNAWEQFLAQQNQAARKQYQSGVR